MLKACVILFLLFETTRKYAINPMTGQVTSRGQGQCRTVKGYGPGFHHYKDAAIMNNLQN